MNKEYIIQGRYKDGKYYLYTLAGYTLEDAKTALNEVLANPSRYNPKYKLFSEFRIKEVVSGDCWWNQGSLD